MTLPELYQIYGKQMVDLEILQSQIQQTKQSIANEINKQNQPKEITADKLATDA